MRRSTALAGVVAVVLPLGLAAADGAATASTPIYLDHVYPPAERAADLVSRMTLPEKASQMVSSMAAAIPRLGVAAYGWWNEAAHGVAREQTNDGGDPPDPDQHDVVPGLAVAGLDLEPGPGLPGGVADLRRGPRGGPRQPARPGLLLADRQSGPRSAVGPQRRDVRRGSAAHRGAGRAVRERVAGADRAGRAAAGLGRLPQDDRDAEALRGQQQRVQPAERVVRHGRAHPAGVLHRPVPGRDPVERPGLDHERVQQRERRAVGRQRAPDRHAGASDVRLRGLFHLRLRRRLRDHGGPELAAARRLGPARPVRPDRVRADRRRGSRLRSGLSRRLELREQRAGRRGPRHPHPDRRLHRERRGRLAGPPVHGPHRAGRVRRRDPGAVGRGGPRPARPGPGSARTPTGR